MSCPYYTFRSNDYYCQKKGDYVNTDVYQRYCKNYSYDDCPIYKGESSSGGCYLTTACVVARGLPDNCTELTTLRSFRDQWLKAQPGGSEEIREYYACAPTIVKRINSCPNAIEIWNKLFDELVSPCVAMIQSGQPETAHIKYRETARQLKEAYGVVS